MEKSEVMKRYERETGFYAYKNQGAGMDTSVMYGVWLEEELIKAQAKATAYDRIMSGGKKTLKEWANVFHMPFAINDEGKGFAYDDIPKILGGMTHWHGFCICTISHRFIDFTGNWQDSLTMPDEWEAK